MSSKKFGRGRGRSRKGKTAAGDLEAAYQLQRAYAAGIDAQFEHFLQTRHGAEWRTVLDAARLESERVEFRRRRNRFLRQRRHFGATPPFRPTAAGHVLPPPTPTSQDDPPAE
jgi:hypothetical protein